MKPVIFCDFDGTITTNDNIIAIMKEFAPPEWNEIKDQILEETISIQQGVGQLFRLLPSSSKQQLIDFILADAKIREGFDDFVAYTKEQGIELIIVSGGIDFFVYPLLKAYELPVYCNSASFDEETIKIEWPHECDAFCENDCGCCKPSIIRKEAKGRDIIVIGDSITDLQAAKQADFVLARDLLLEKCQQLNLKHAPFVTFHDCIEMLNERGLES
ncbi:2-hydroxy-3-keto-5-methylthiopentenyl-1-phosphate phosphatase [Halalkalibacter sp. APA_J-10(15)]|uniref:2-hydroxy-3-keto-5-methylthiopentenyl-1- phosphate phosphatase n=1 Tax=unclassified Halalkalibacter TaxID=2893063 RepID=UPI001FF6DC53|nr:2-hydroxy-3-keto-5-methylthiopentenyl-1-phosphate phosphatase [Halalkalibacter sp. APA_J-10(15)]MCK0473163.1 2-hydroxy-3-keto-5-methylthiopentenyl-1-phosphate phosphatase [Halalkalibacter sp. APA_J-10(15)]